jgi:hypothetical protein
MLGLGDLSIFIVYCLCILSALACVIYGIIYWNKGADIDEDLEKNKKWEEEEHEITENLDI